jgi:hypothetical protein
VSVWRKTLPAQLPKVPRAEIFLAIVRASYAPAWLERAAAGGNLTTTDAHRHQFGLAPGRRGISPELRADP